MLHNFRGHTSQEHNVTAGMEIPPWKGCSVGHPYFVTKLYRFLGSWFLFSLLVPNEVRRNECM